MVRHCNKCGNKLTLTVYNVYSCANCGILPMNNLNDDEDLSESPAYIG